MSCGEERAQLPVLDQELVRARRARPGSAAARGAAGRRPLRRWRARRGRRSRSRRTTGAPPRRRCPTRSCRRRRPPAGPSRSRWPHPRSGARRARAVGPRRAVRASDRIVGGRATDQNDARRDGSPPAGPTQEASRLTHRVTLIPGDGIGPEVIEAARRAIEATGVVDRLGAQAHGGGGVLAHRAARCPPRRSTRSARTAWR